MRQFYVSKDSIGLIRTAYSTYEGSQVLTDYRNDTTPGKVARGIQNNKKQPDRLEDKVSPAQVTTP